MQFSDKLVKGNSLTWEITGLEVFESVDSETVEELTDTKYPLFKKGSKITVEILQDVGNLLVNVFGNNEFNPNEVFRESVNGTVIEIQDPFLSPQIFLETSNFDLDGSLNYQEVITVNLIYPIAYVYTNQTIVEFAEYQSHNFEDKGRTIEVISPYYDIIIHKETGIVLEADTTISSSKTPIQISFKLIEYNGDADIIIQNTEKSLSWNNGFLFLPIVIIIIIRKKNQN